MNQDDSTDNKESSTSSTFKPVLEDDLSVLDDSQLYTTLDGRAYSNAPSESASDFIYHSMLSTKYTGLSSSEDSDYIKSKQKSKYDIAFIQTGWSNPNIATIPSIYLLERSSCHVDCKLRNQNIVMDDLAECFRTLSLWTKYVDNPAGSAHFSQDQVELYVNIWKVEDGQKICIEVQRRQGDSLKFHQYANHILDAALGKFDSNEFEVNYVHSESRHQKLATMLTQIGWSKDSYDKPATLKNIAYAFSLINDESLGNKILGMESLCILSDVRKATMSVAYTVSHCVLFGDGKTGFDNVHQFVFCVIQERQIPGYKSMLIGGEKSHDFSNDIEYFFDDDEEYKIDMSSEYSAAMRSLRMYGFTIVANCLEVITILKYQNDLSNPDTKGREASLNVLQLIAGVLKLTRIDLLRTLLEVLGEGNTQPHNACQAARCLMLLCRLSSRVCKTLIEQNVLQIANQAKELGSVQHLMLRRECEELLHFLEKK